jgi:hypothetical protein
MTLTARSGGRLAVALGIAAAAAIALADQASAAPRGSSVDASAHDSRGPSAHSVHRQPQGRAAAARQAPAGLTPAAATSARRSVRTAAIAPVVSVPVATVPATAMASTAAPKTYPRWDSRGRLITIYKGTHFVIPNQWALWVTKDSGEATFTADSAYDLKDEDQYDWNKLAGITFTPWRPDRNSSMVVWRYNLQNGMYEIGPFFDVDFAYVFPAEDEIITVPADQTFTYSVDYNGISVSYGGQTVYKSTPADLTPNFWTSARVTGWFGGSEVAPRTVSYYQHQT